jgi:hypothetical protein
MMMMMVVVVVVFQNVSAAGCVHLFVVPVNGFLCSILMLFHSVVVLYTSILLQTAIRNMPVHLPLAS